MAVSTFHRRRQYRDKHDRQVTFADLHRANMLMGIYCGISALGVFCVLMIALFGNGAMTLFFGN